MKRYALLALVVALVVYPLVWADQFFLSVILNIYFAIILAVSLNLIMRAGMLSLAHAAFMGIGGYTSALTVMRLGFPFLAALLAAGLVAGALSLLFGRLLIRLRGVYFVLVTFSFGEVVRLFFVNVEHPFGGTTGVLSIPAPRVTFLTSSPSAARPRSSRTRRSSAPTWEKTMSSLELAGVSVQYGPTQALKGIDVRAPKGSIVALIGPNGAGKTTALKAVMGLQPVAGGEIRLGGERIDRLDTAEIVRRGIALCPEGRRVFPEMTVSENLQTGAYLRGSRRAVEEDRETIYRYFPVLKTRGTQMAATLSGGEQQMLAIGRALMARPQYLLLDEPSLGLAPLIVRAIGDIIREIHAAGVSIVLVEQNARMALRLAEQAYVLESGRVVLGGPSADLAKDDYVRRVYLGA